MHIRRSSVRSHWLLAGVLSAIVLAAMPAAATQIDAGQTVREALNELRREGLHLLYSSDVVDARLRVAASVNGTDGEVLAREILRPHQLELAPGPAHRWLVVRGTTDRPSSSDSQAAPTTRSNGESLSAITVTASRYPLGNVTDTHFLSREQIAQMPHMADDPLRILRQLPGISGSDFSASMYIRGGARDETAILVDGVRIHDPFHLKNMQGALGVVDAGIVEGIDVMTGAFPAQYGDRMSGIVSMQTLAPAERNESTLGISFVNAFARSRGPLADGRGHWLVSARRGYLDWLFQLIDSDGDFTPRYWDVFAKADWAIGDATVISGNALIASDELRYVESGPVHEQSLGDARSAYGWLTASTQWSGVLASDTVLSWSGIERTRDNESEDDGVMSNVHDRRDFDFTALRSDWRWDASKRVLVMFGAELRHTQAHYDYLLLNCAREPFLVGPCIVDRSHGAEVRVSGDSYAAYAATRWRTSAASVLEMGVRADHQDYANLSQTQYSLRIGWRMDISPETTVRLGWGQYYQSQQPEELQVEDGQTSFDPAERAEHRVLSFEHRFANALSLRTELFDKEYSDVRARHENLTGAFEVVPEGKLDRVTVDPVTSRIYGAEIGLAAAPTDTFSWRLGYAYLRSRDRFADGSEAPRSWDQTHAVTGGFSWSFKGWDLGAFATWHTGWPTTPVSFDVEQQGSVAIIDPDVGPRNSRRVSAYKRLDLRLSRTARLAHSELNYFFELYNAFDASNICCLDDAIVYTDGSGTHVYTDYDDWLPLLPSFGIQWTF